MNKPDKPLIAGVDGSDPSLRALDWAVDVAVSYGVPLRVVHASRWEWYEGHEPSFGINRPSVQALSDHIAASAVERAQRRTSAVKVTGEVLSEDPAVALARLGSEAGAVVVGSRGRGELTELLLGSVSLSVAAHAASPVIVVRGHEKNVKGGFRSVVLGIDLPQEATLAVDFAFREAQSRDASLSVVHTWRCPALEVPDFPTAVHDEHQQRATAQVEEILREALAAYPDIAVRRKVVEGHARTVLLDASRTADLLVVGARRRKGHVGMQLGPVNHAVLHHAACPVAVVPHA
ncbi:universal stress protein [Streptomyces longisporoflavus]|uniref:universal stress protein n=1 Tax=Streptomyces longisporoflavus TaxID=28044 RepID=UPI0019B8E086|nr:universal stress protein [Streptomyces longisporoflavus]GGV65837.1 universal stress protein [Streptomyces longisporoflavus]